MIFHTFSFIKSFWSISQLREHWALLHQKGSYGLDHVLSLQHPWIGTSYAIESFHIILHLSFPESLLDGIDGNRTFRCNDSGCLKQGRFKLLLILQYFGDKSNLESLIRVHISSCIGHLFVDWLIPNEFREELQCT